MSSYIHIDQNIYTSEKRQREGKYKQENQNPSFSSTLLDEIYRSIDDEKDGRIKKEDSKFCRETMGKKQSTKDSHYNIKARKQGDQVEDMMKIQHDRLMDRYIKMKTSEQDALFFSSASSSFDSSSGGFSSSDTESWHGLQPSMSCFMPKMLNPVRTNRSEKKCKTQKHEKTSKSERTLFQEQRKLHTLNDYHYNSAPAQNSTLEDSICKSKSRALNIYSNLKKTPISPGVRLTSFLNNLFTAGHTNKSKPPSQAGGHDDVRSDRRHNSEQVSTCSSACSFSRSCLSKNSSSTREKLTNADKRTVRFCPVSVIVDEGSRPCGKKTQYEEQHHSTLMPVSVPTAWRIGKSSSRKIEEDVKYQVMERSKKIEEMARDFLKDYHYALNHKKNDAVLRDVMHRRCNRRDEDGDDHAGSCSSSDLFELDHLLVIGKDRYHEELPVYETTSVDSNRAISSLIM